MCVHLQPSFTIDDVVVVFLCQTPIDTVGIEEVQSIVDFVDIETLLL